MVDQSWLRRVKLQQFRVVLAVANSSSLVKAANELGLSQPAVTKIIHELEKELDAELFVRTSKGSHPTPLGKRVCECAQIIFSQIEKTATEISAIQSGLSGQIVVGTLLAGSANILPRAIARLNERSPGINIRVIEGTYDHLMPLLKQGTLDFITGRLPAYKYRDGISVKSYYEEEVAIVTRPGHPVYQIKKPTLKHLYQWPWVMPLPDTTIRKIIEAAFHEKNLELPRIACESLSVITNRKLIIETDYIGVYPAQVVQPDIDVGLLQRVKVSPSITFGSVGICWLKGHSFSDCTAELIKELDLVVKDI